MIIYLLLAFIALVLVLSIFPFKKGSLVAIIFGAVAIFLASLITAGRTIYLEDDFLNYYDLFYWVTQGDWGVVANYGGGFEVGLPIILSLFGLFLGQVTQSQLLFIVTFTSTMILFSIYIAVTQKIKGDRSFGLDVACSVVFMSFFTASHTSRQFVSGALLLPLIALNIKYKGKVILSLLSFIFHSTGVLFSAIIEACRHRVGLIALSAVVVVFILLPDFMLGQVELFVPSLFRSKLTILSAGEQGGQDISNIPDLVRLLALSMLVFVSRKMKLGQVPSHTEKYVYLSTAVFGALVNIPFIGNRLDHMIINVSFGLIVLLALCRVPALLRVTIVLGLFYQVRLLWSY